MRPENSMITNPKRLWVYVNSIRHNDDIPNQMSLGDEHADTNKSIANLLANYFKSVYACRTELNFQLSLSDIIYFSFVNIGAEDVKLKLMNLDATKGAGPDGFPLPDKVMLSRTNRTAPNYIQHI